MCVCVCVCVCFVRYAHEVPDTVNMLKGRYPVNNTVKRLQDVKRWADIVFVIPSVDPSPYLDAVVDRYAREWWCRPALTLCANSNCGKICFMRGDDMPQFPGRVVAERLGMEVCAVVCCGVRSSSFARHSHMVNTFCLFCLSLSHADQADALH